MAMTAKKAKAVPVATAEAASDAEARILEEVAAEKVRATHEANADTETVAMAAGASRSEIFIPLNKLKKSPRNARKTRHTETHIEALAASIAAKGMQVDRAEPNWETGSQQRHCFHAIRRGNLTDRVLFHKKPEPSLASRETRVGTVAPASCGMGSGSTVAHQG